MIDQSRITQLNAKPVLADGQSVVYWMQSEQRPNDNWALSYAIEQANALKVPLVVVFFVWETGRDPQLRHYDFMLRGLADTAIQLRSKGIGFVLRRLEPVQGILDFSREVGACLVVTDRSPLNHGRLRRSKAATRLDVPLTQVDARFIVPPEVVSDKAFFAAYHARPKLQSYYPRFITDQPTPELKYSWHDEIAGEDVQDTKKVMSGLKLGTEASALDVPSGPTAADARWNEFLALGMQAYEVGRNNPIIDATSRLSAYLHFGQISSQRIAYDLLSSPEAAVNPSGVDAYLNELITWRELAANFTTYVRGYATVAAIPEWAQKSLSTHLSDVREHIYDLAELENAQTDDPLWNASQLEMVKSGRMHGYMRMYWAKKLLEWSETPAAAIHTAVFLNDRYELDGRDANSYAGILWAIGGLHDRPWFDRPVFGQIRYMNANGARNKFDVDAYIARWS